MHSKTHGSDTNTSTHINPLKPNFSLETHRLNFGLGFWMETNTQQLIPIQQILHRHQHQHTSKYKPMNQSEYTPKPRGGNSCLRVGFVLCQVMSIQLYELTQTRLV